MTCVREGPVPSGYPVLMTAFGRRLYEVRVRRGLPAAGVAHQMRCPVWRLFAWEMGREIPNVKQIRDLARALRVSEYDLTAVPAPPASQQAPEPSVREA